MHNRSHGNEWESLKADLETESCRALLDESKARHTWLHQYPTWLDVLDHAHRMDPNDPAKDRLLGAIFGDARAQRFQGWHSVLLALYWPDLERIHRQKAHWDSDAERRWGNVTWAYLCVAERIDPAIRSTGLARKLFNDTVHAVYEIYSREWETLAREVPTDPIEIAEQYDRYYEPSHPPLDEAALRDTALANLQAHLEAKRISEADYLLILGTRIYGKSLAECAQQAGLAYQAAKKRRQRAESTVRDFNKTNEIFQDAMSPRPDSAPLSPLREEAPREGGFN